MIYLDYAASTPILPEVKQKLINTLDIYGNPSSIHDEGIKARKIVDEAKDIVAQKINCTSEEVYFTSGATMSNSVLLKGFKGGVLCSAIEHDDILMMNKHPKIPVDKYGLVDLDALDDYLKRVNIPILVSIQMANSEIGTIQDIKKISKIIHSYGAFLHTDATQYIPHYPIDVKAMGIDALSMSGQKIGCIKGSGLLYVSNELLSYVNSVIYGKQGLIGGTENVPGIACLGEAFKELYYNKEETRLRDMLIDGLNGDLIGSKEHRLPNNVCMCFEGIDAQTIVTLLNDREIYCSAGSACSSGSTEPSSTLRAIGLDDNCLNSCVRFTLGKNTTENEILKTIDEVNSIVGLLRELQ